MGPFKVIGSFFHEQGWAHSKSSAAFLMGKDGPIQGHRQLSSLARMGPFIVIGSFSYEL
jgi:hypothetical protein